jgi:cyclic-di-GMP-binding protein
MPSFDVVSEIELHELHNAIDQANREVNTRFDFKNTNARYELNDTTIVLTAPTEFHIKQMLEILKNKMAKRNIDIRSLDEEPIATNLNEAKMEIKVKKGIDKEVAKKIIKLIKDAKLKVQTAIQGEQIRITGKKRDDLQTAIAALREAKLDLPLQYINFRD